jgi:spore coat protein U-like protein
MMRRLLLTAATLGLVVAAPARAATNTGTLAVSANVVTSCEITASALNFNNYDGAQNDSTATITVNCNTASVPYTVTLGAGGSWTGTTRQMANGVERLDYALYTDAGRVTLWQGLTSMGSTTSAASPSTDNTLVVYGRIPANQILTTTGVYSDSVVMTVTF